MRKTIAIFCVSLMVALPAFADESTSTAEPARISVTGQAEVEMVPDMAVINLGVTRDAKEAPEALDAVAEVTAALLARLTESGVEARDVQTSHINISPRFNYNHNNDAPPKLVGFTASTMLNVRVRDLEKLGAIITDVTHDGANQFNGLRFSLQEPETAQMAARADAVKDAMARATTLAEAAGLALGRVVSISEGGASAPQPPVMMEMARSASADMPIAAGELSVSARVSMVFEVLEE